LFIAYPIALIGKADSQEDAPFSIAPFISCCDSGVISPKVHHRCFRITDVFATNTQYNVLVNQVFANPVSVFILLGFSL